MKPLLLLPLLLLSTPAQAFDGGLATVAAFVVSATQDAGNPGGYNSGSSVDDDGGDD